MMIGSRISAILLLKELRKLGAFSPGSGIGSGSSSGSSLLNLRRNISLVQMPDVPSSSSLSLKDKDDTDSDAGDGNDDDDDDSSSSCWKSFDPKELGVGGTYGLGVSAIVPRPIAVITTLSSLPPSSETDTDTDEDTDMNMNMDMDMDEERAGDLLRTFYDENGIIVNCAPFSYTGLLSHDPPMVCHGICLTSNGTRKKDTLINIEHTKEWVFNILSASWVEQANACAVECDPDTSEIDVAKLHILPCGETLAYPATPRLREAMVSMECQLDSIKEIYNDEGVHTTSVVFGRIVRYHVHTSVLSGDLDANRPTIDLEKMQFVGRAGGDTYYPAGEGKTVSIKRP